MWAVYSVVLPSPLMVFLISPLSLTFFIAWDVTLWSSGLSSLPTSSLRSQNRFVCQVLSTCVCASVCVCLFVCVCVFFCLCLCVCAHKTDLWARYCQPASVCAITCHQFSVFCLFFVTLLQICIPCIVNLCLCDCVCVWLISPSLLVFCNSVWLCSPSCFFVTLLQPLTSERSASAAPKMELLRPSPLRRSLSTWWAFL